LIADGLIRYRAVNRGIVLDEESGVLTFPKSYGRESVKLSEVEGMSATKSTHSGAQFGVSTYTYDLNLQGKFGTQTLVFNSKESRDRVQKEIERLTESRW